MFINTLPFIHNNRVNLLMIVDGATVKTQPDNVMTEFRTLNRQSFIQQNCIQACGRSLFARFYGVVPD